MKKIYLKMVLVFGLFAGSVQSATVYVDASRPDDTGAGDSWGTAKRTIQAGVDAASDDDTVLVANGTYDEGGAVTPGYSLMNRVSITKMVRVESVSGPNVTLIKGAAGSNGGNDTNAVRGVYMANGCSLIGFSIIDGHTTTSGHFLLNQSAGGIYMNVGCMASNCTVSGNSAKYYAGGSLLFEGGTLTHCEIKNNTSSAHGGGVRLHRGGTMSDSEISGNVGSGNGGGVHLYQGGTVSDCTISTNSAIGDSGFGGGAHCDFGGAINNSIFTGNDATLMGGGVLMSYGGTLNNSVLIRNETAFGGGLAIIRDSGGVFGTANNCVLVENTATDLAGGAYLSDAGELNNCIIRGNTAPEWSGIGINSGALSSGNYAIRYTCSTDLARSLTNGVDGCITNNPLFVNQAGENFQLQPSSPCINAGHNSYAPSGPDLAGNARIVGTVDMGAYESAFGPLIEMDVSELSVPEDDSAIFRVRLSKQPENSTTVSVMHVSGDSSISVIDGATLTFTTNNWSTYQSATLFADEDPDYTNGIAVIRCAADGLNPEYLNVTEIDNDGDPAYALPWSEPFEERTLGDLAGQHGWTGDGTVQTGTVHEGSQALALTNGTAAHLFLGEATNVWLSFWINPVLSEAAPESIDASATAVFYVNTNRQLVVYDSTNETVLTSTVVSNDWNKIEISADYSSKVWNLSLNNLPRVGNFAFYSDQTALSGFQFIEQSTNTFFVDTLSVTDSNTDADADGLPDEWENSWYGDLSPNPSDLSSNGVDTVYAAYIAGFDPTDPDAVFEVSNAWNILSWNATSGRVYTVYWTSNLLSGFQPLETNLPWTGVPFTDTNHFSKGQGFYKIDVELE